MADAVVYPPLTRIDTVTPAYTLGTIVEDGSGNEWIYLQGVALTAAGSCVSYNPSTFATTLSVAAASGRIAFAAAASVALTYGWYCIKGTCACITAGTTVAGSAAFIVAASAGVVDDAVVATDRLENAYFTTATTPAGSISIVYPQALGLG